MKKFLAPLVSFTLLLASAAIAQQQSGEIQSDISSEISRFELPPITLDASMGYQSNIDLLDKNQYQVKYKDSAILNLSGGTKMVSEIMDMPLTYTPSIKGTILQDGDYDRSSDVFRRVNFNNNLYLETFKTEKISFGPTLDLNAEKRFTHAGFHRKRDNINGFIGLKSSVKASSELMFSNSAAVGYLNHSGNYVDLNSQKRRFEHGLEEDRAIYKANFTTVWKANSIMTLSMPISYQRDNFTQRRARAAKTGFDAIDRDLASWSALNNQPYMDEALDMQNIAAGLSTDLSLGLVSVSAAYTFLDDKEMNKGQGRNDADTDNYEFSLSSNLDALSLALSYSNENIHYNYLLGGSTEITQSYVTDIKLAKVINDINANLKLSYTDYQFSSPNVSWSEKAEDIVAMIGVSTTL